MCCWEECKICDGSTIIKLPHKIAEIEGQHKCVPMQFEKDFSNSNSPTMKYECEKCIEFVEINEEGKCPICDSLLDIGMKEVRDSLKKLKDSFVEESASEDDF